MKISQSLSQYTEYKVSPSPRRGHKAARQVWVQHTCAREQDVLKISFCPYHYREQKNQKNSSSISVCVLNMFPPSLTYRHYSIYILTVSFHFHMFPKFWNKSRFQPLNHKKLQKPQMNWKSNYLLWHHFCHEIIQQQQRHLLCRDPLVEQTVSSLCLCPGTFE